jgi:glycosyltransferase involved in cell wall biosynthesis
MLKPSQSHYKIIHTTCHTQWGGLEKRIFNEAVWMRNNGHDIIVAAPRNTPLLHQSRQNGFRTYEVDFKKSDMLSDYRFLRRLFANEQPDIVNTHGNEDARIALVAAYRTKIGCRILSRHISAHVRNSWYNRLIYKKYATYIFTTADYTTRHLRQVFNLNDRQVFSMPSGILPPDSMPPRESARKNLADTLGCPPDSRFVGFVGRLSEDKGVTTLVQAFKQVLHHIPHHLILVGNGPDVYREQLEKMTRDPEIASRTHFMGFTDDVWSVYRALDCKVLASENINGIPFEGVPQALLEAMYCECPVIGSKTGGIPDIIEHRITGLLFDPGDADTLATLMLETLFQETATRERAETAFKKVLKNHTIEAMGRNILRIYHLHHRLNPEKNESTDGM